jgi:hypothetical protein
MTKKRKILSFFQNKEKEKVFLSVKLLKEKLVLSKNPVALNASKDLEKILADLHKLGTIIYFKEEVLKSTLISNPQWFNNVFKTILDYGRKLVELKFEFFFENLNNENKISESKKEIEKILDWLKGKSKKKLRKYGKMKKKSQYQMSTK